MVTIWDLLIGLEHFLLLELLSRKFRPFPEPLRPAVGPRLSQHTLINLLLHRLHSLPKKQQAGGHWSGC